MTAATSGPPPLDLATTRRLAKEPPLARFDVRTRIVHWVNATWVVVLMVTGAALYAGPVSAIVGNRDLVRDVHVWVGLTLPIPLLLGVFGHRGAALRGDLSRLNRWARGDVRWFRRRVRRRGGLDLGKFNPGQKLNAAFLLGAGLVLYGTGALLHWFRLFPLDWRTGATFVHDWFALGIWVAVIGHVLFALNDGDALEAMMVNGKVPARWAHDHAPRWYREQRPTASDVPATAALEPDTAVERGDRGPG